MSNLDELAKITQQRIRGMRPKESTRGPVLIEQTGKRWKAWMLVGGAMTVIGIAVALYGLFGNPASPPNVNGAWAGVAVAVAGLVLFFGANILAWWHHG